MHLIIEELLQYGLLSRSGDQPRILVNSFRTIPHAVSGFFDSLDQSGNMWLANGWAVDPESKEPCSYVFLVQDGEVCTDAVYEKAIRQDVNQYLRIPPEQITGFRASFRPNSSESRVTAIAVWPSGTLAILPGPAIVTPDEGKSVQTGVNISEAEWQAKCSCRLYPFSVCSPFRGLYSFESEYDPAHMAGVTSQFLEEAATYHRKYTEHPRWRLLLSQAFLRAEIDERRPLSVLDVGSGSGNTVIPLLRLLPLSSIIATDISPQLLAILRDQMRDMDRRRVCLISMNAAEKAFRSQTFDLVVGAAILHHIIDPSDTLSACEQSLRPGGRAIFFEPFEEGYLLLRLLYEQLLASRTELSLTDEVIQILQALIIDIDVRKGSDKSADIYQRIDDKWSFTRSYFERQKAKHGYSKVEFYPLDISTSRFSAQLKTHLRLCLNRGDDAVTPQTWECVQAFEKKLSLDLYSDLLMEACVILTK